MPYRTFWLFLTILFLLSCGGGGGGAAVDNGCPSYDADAVPDEMNEPTLPDIEQEAPNDEDQADDQSDQTDQSDEAVVDEDDIPQDTDDLSDDGDTILVPVCFEKPCDGHDACSLADSACAPFAAEGYACAPDLTDFGYRGGGSCLAVDCATDGDCREDIGYICLQFGAPSDAFNGASSVCARSLSGMDCADESKKVCQFDKNIAITCTDGVWKPYFCEEGWFCEDGECIREVLDSDAIMPDADIVPQIEICDGIDNNGNTLIDEGCDDDGDGWCDVGMIVYGQPAICPNGMGDCDDEDPNIYPGSIIHQEGVDYDCDNRKEYLATIVISVDDELVDLCVNGSMILPLGPYKGNWTRTDTYTVIMESGPNAVGMHGIDTGTVISAFIATITVNGQILITDGVMPPADGIAYTPDDIAEWFGTEWRYFPTMEEGPNASWCDKWFDDSAWGPGIRAGITGSTPVDQWGHLGAYPWTNTGCGHPRCPGDFIPYYEDAIIGNEPMWIWDYNPTSLADAWLRRIIILP